MICSLGLQLTRFLLCSLGLQNLFFDFSFAHWATYQLTAKFVLQLTNLPWPNIFLDFTLLTYLGICFATTNLPTVPNFVFKSMIHMLGLKGDKIYFNCTKHVNQTICLRFCWLLTSVIHYCIDSCSFSYKCNTISWEGINTTTCSFLCSTP